MNTKKEKDQVVMVVGVVPPERHSWNDAGYYNVKVHIGRMVRPGDGYTSEFCGPEVVDGLYARGLTLSAQGDRKSCKVYGGEIRYEEVFCADLYKLKHMVKTLETIQKRADVMNRKFGHVPDFAEGIMRFGLAVKASRVYLDEAHTRHGVRDGLKGHQGVPFKDARYHVAGFVRFAEERFSAAKSEAV